MTDRRGSGSTADGAGPQVSELRANIESTRREISTTISEIERRLSPQRMKERASDRFAEATAPWRQDPAGQLEAWMGDGLTRLREMAWTNPLGLGLAAAVAGFLLGRSSGRD